MKNNTLLSNEKFNRIQWKNYAGLFTFIFFIVRMVFLMPKNFSEMSDPWSTSFYAIDYKTMGFVPRAFVGSVCALFSDYISGKAIYIISLCATVLLVVIACILINKVVKNLSNNESLIFLFLVSLLLIAPEGVHYLFDKEHMGITDIYFIMLTLLIVLCSEHKIFRWFIPLICGVCMSIYEGYVFSLGAVVGIVLLYMIYKSPKKVAPIIITVLCAIAIVSTFFYYCYFFRADYLGAVKFETYNEMLDALSKRTDTEMSFMLEQLYFWCSTFTVFTDGRWDIAKVFSSAVEVRRECLPTFLAVYLTALTLWIPAFRNEKDRFLKFIYFLCSISLVFSLPLFVFSQQMKYITYNVFTQIILVGFFAIKEKTFSAVVEERGKSFANNPLIMLAVWVALILFSNI